MIILTCIRKGVVRNMEFTCRHTSKKRTQTWQGTIKIINVTGNHVEASMTGRGSYFHVITGPQMNGNYICIPNYNTGSELASYKDLLWNKEQLTRSMGIIDATTVATGLTYLPDIMRILNCTNLVE